MKKRRVIFCPWIGILDFTDTVAQLVKNLPAVQEPRVRSLGWEDPWRRKWQLTPVSLPGKSHGQKSLVGCSPWGHKESGTTEWLRLTLTLSKEPALEFIDFLLFFNLYFLIFIISFLLLTLVLVCSSFTNSFR